MVSCHTMDVPTGSVQVLRGSQATITEVALSSATVAVAKCSVFFAVPRAMATPIRCLQGLWTSGKPMIMNRTFERRPVVSALENILEFLEERRFVDLVKKPSGFIGSTSI